MTRSRSRSVHRSHSRPHPPGIEHALGIEALLDPLRQRRQRRRPAARTTSSAARTGAGARISVAWPPAAATARAHERGAGIVAPAPAHPDQAAGPIVEHLGTRPRRRSRAPSSRPPAGRGRDPPERALAAPRGSAANGVDVADRAPELARRRISPITAQLAERLQQAPRSIRLAMRDRGRERLRAAAPSARAAADRRSAWHARGRRRRQMRRAGDVAGRPHAPPSWRRDRRCVVEAERPAPSPRSRARQHLEVTSVIAASVPQEPAISLQRS